MTQQRGAVRHDDRGDVLAIGVNYWVEQMASDATEIMNDRREKLLDEELEKFVDGILSRKGQKNQDTWF
jgi:prefoldin subunit 5